jgi:hypothetical protein
MSDKSDLSVFGSAQSVSSTNQKPTDSPRLTPKFNLTNGTSNPPIVSYLQQNANKLCEKISNVMSSQIERKANDSLKIKETTKVSCGVVVTSGSDSEHQLRRR